MHKKSILIILFFRAINIEWDTYNNIVQTSDRQVQYEREDAYFASTSSYPGSSQIVYEEDGYYMPLRNGSQMLAEHEVLTISKGPLRLRKQSIHSRPISRKAALKSTGGVRTKNRANQLMLNPDKVFLCTRIKFTSSTFKKTIFSYNFFHKTNFKNNQQNR